MRNKNYEYYEHKKISTFKELLDNTLDYRDNIAFSYRDKDKIVSVTNDKFYHDVSFLSNYFNHYYKNKHIALIGENSYQWIVLFISIVMSGNVVVVMDKDLNESDLSNLMNKSDTSIIYYSNSYCSFIDHMKYKKNRVENISSLIKEGENYQNKYITKENNDAAIFFTSGTTGPNKGVVLTEKSICTDLYAAASLFKPGGSAFSTLPFHHTFGIITSILKPVYYHVPVFINKSLKYIMQDLQEFKPDTMFVVPLYVETFYRTIWRTARKDKSSRKLKLGLRINKNFLRVGIDLSNPLFKKSLLDKFGGNLKNIICGGAYLSPKYVKFFRNLGINVLNGYGITECSPVVAVNRNYFYKDGSVGQICRGVEVKIIDNEVCVKGDIVMKGYYKDKKSTKQSIPDGYFHTGDLGYLDNKGFLFITGRIKNIIILSNGENISPELIEGELLKYEEIQEVVVYEKNDKLIAQIYPSEEYLSDKNHFNNLIYEYNKNKPKNHQISIVELRDTEFIKNNNKKILRNKINERS